MYVFWRRPIERNGIMQRKLNANHCAGFLPDKQRFFAFFHFAVFRRVLVAFWVVAALPPANLMNGI